MQLNAVTELSQINLTSHAKLRINQRGLKKAVIHAVYEHADVELQVGGNCCRLYISSRELRRLVTDGILAAYMAERCKNVMLIESGGDLVTAYRH